MSDNKLLFNSPEWQDLQESQKKFEEKFEKESEEAWSKLDQDTQIKIFCAVSRKIYKAELEDKGTYRHALYRVFGFGPEAYSLAQFSGYLAIHNAIYAGSEGSLEIIEKIKNFAEENNISSEKTSKFIEDILNTLF